MSGQADVVGAWDRPTASALEVAVHSPVIVAIDDGHINHYGCCTLDKESWPCKAILRARQQAKRQADQEMERARRTTPMFLAPTSR